MTETMNNEMRTVETVIAELGKEKYSEMRAKFIEEEGAIGSAEDVLAHFGLMEDSISIIGHFPAHHVEDIEPATSNREHEEIETRNNITTNTTTAEQVNMLLGTMPSKDEMKEISNNVQSTADASEGQMKYYRDLCEQKGEVASTKTFTKAEVDVQIKRLKEMPYFKACSEKQINRITEDCKAMNMPLPDFSKLNGAYNGSASKFIQKLNDMKKNMVFPISDKQTAMIANMQYCPDCEVVEDIKAMSSKDASEYISKYKTDFYLWKNSRLTDSQLLTLLTLQCRIEDVSIKDILDSSDSISEKIVAVLPKQSISYQSWIQFDKDNATKQIIQTEKELKDEGLLESTLEPEDMYLIKTAEQEDARNELRNLVAKLYASIGQELEEEFYELMDWNGLKELIEFVKMFGIDVESMLDRITIFDANQKEALLA